MKKILMILLPMLISSAVFAQLNSTAYFNRSSQDQSDDLRPWYSGGVRSVEVTDDLDGDGKLEILATDYSNGGRVHVFEYVDSETLELVWSSPAGLYEGNPNSTPRWVQYGDLDGDGNKEIIFPLGPRYEGAVQVFEHKGADNDYGTESILDFPSDAHTSLGHDLYRMDRERGTVYDFDGDGQSELIMANADNNVYILSISGDAPGFASWTIEGGSDVENNTGSLYSTISQWHSVPADIDGDGNIEIVNHNWNFFGMSSIDVNGPDSYTYPTDPQTGKSGPAYMEFMNADQNDYVGFMGVAVADVDGDGKDEIASLSYSNYTLYLISQPQGANGVYIWDDVNKMSMLKSRFDLSVKADSFDQYWACYAEDLNMNGRDEILVGGFYDENVIAVEYNGSGDIMDGTNYDVMYYYGGETETNWEFQTITISDSAGVIDTQYSYAAWANPGVMKMSSGDIVGNDGKPELVVSYQADTYDSVEVINRTWNGSSWDEATSMIYNDRNIQIRVLQYESGTGVKDLNMNIITPNEYVLEQNYPNPFNPTTNIRFSLPVAKKISLIVYDMLGREVKTLINAEEFAKGSFEATWDGTNNAGQKVASGSYIYTLKYGNFQKSAKMTLLK